MEQSTDKEIWYFKSTDVNALHCAPADFRIPYGQDPMQFGDLRLPKTQGPHPVAIIVHGGCWISTFASLQNTAALSDALRGLGIATWNIEYRQIDNGGGWPGTLLDVAHATDFLREIAKKYSLGLNRLIVIGHSAGGHLALWIAGRHRLEKSSTLYIENPLPFRGVISFAAVPDLLEFREQGKTVCGQDVIRKLLGEDEAEIHTHLKEISPIEMLPLGIPQILIYGKEDSAVPPKFAENYTHLAKKAGDKIKLLIIPNAAHHESNVPNSIMWHDITAAVKELLDK